MMRQRRVTGIPRSAWMRPVPAVRAIGKNIVSVISDRLSLLGLHPFDHPDLFPRFDGEARLGVRSGMGGCSCPFAGSVFVVLLNTHDLRTGGPVTGHHIHTCSIIIANCDRRTLLSCALVAGGVR
ncbi:hypothetical protein GCM10009541_00400 [Micromonospora gifhornensis]|uniref:Uncharacterized protein n=1 Tax=Micromonospora gifhornensis TaxID=84594 RepID=A0ABQ4IJG6_9ACTN|nr:hypothetical protein Vgi01_47220 [Micromonospora gifhornensis]